MKRYAIVGFGCAGYHAAQAIRQQDASAEIHVFEMLNDPPFNPMLSTYYASDKISLENAHIFGSFEKIEKELSLQLHIEKTVTAVHGLTKELTFADGSSETFDGIVIATGASAFVPPIAGLPDDRVFAMRTLHDAQVLRQYIDEHNLKTGVVVGASMVGIKVAQLFYERGIKTTIVDAAPRLFPLAALEGPSRFMEGKLKEMGMDFRWNAGVQAICPEGVQIATGETLQADVICLCIGTRANAKLVMFEGSGIKVNRGIVVDPCMRTTAEGVFAAGDCCEGNNLQTNETQIIGLWANAGYQGRTAGTVLAGGKASYDGNIVHNITHFMGMEFVGLGDIRREGTHITFQDGPRFIEAVVADGKIQCANLLECGRISGVLKSIMLRQLAGEDPAVTPMQRAFLLDNGLPEKFIKQLEGEF